MIIMSGRIGEAIVFGSNEITVTIQSITPETVQFSIEATIEATIEVRIRKQVFEPEDLRS